MYGQNYISAVAAGSAGNVVLGQCGTRVRPSGSRRPRRCIASTRNGCCQSSRTRSGQVRWPAPSTSPLVWLSCEVRNAPQGSCEGILAMHLGRQRESTRKVHPHRVDGCGERRFPTTISPAFPRTRTRALGSADGCPLFRGVPACQRQSGAGTGRASRAIPWRRREKATPGTGHVDGLDAVKHVLVDTAAKCARTVDQRFQSPSSRAIDFRVFTLRRPAPIRAEGGLRR